MQNGSQKKSTNLDPLPETKSKFWKDAEVHTELTWQTSSEAEEEVRSTLKKHYFERIPGHQAQCRHCDWGFQLDWGDKIKDGHLYNKNGELVI